MTEEEKKEDAPTAEKPEAAPETKTESKPDPKLKMGEGKIVLAVDDDPGTIELLKGVLEKVGFQVAGAKDGKEAMNKIGITKPNLIIMDVLMPEMDGLTFFKELRKNKETQEIPVLVLTVRKNMEDSFMALGANGFLSKPVDTEALLEKIATLPKTIPPGTPGKDEAAKDAPAKDAPKKDAPPEGKK